VGWFFFGASAKKKELRAGCTVEKGCPMTPKSEKRGGRKESGWKKEMGELDQNYGPRVAEENDRWVFIEDIEQKGKGGETTLRAYQEPPKRKGKILINRIKMNAENVV